MTRAFVLFLAAAAVCSRLHAGPVGGPTGNYVEVGAAASLTLSQGTPTGKRATGRRGGPLGNYLKFKGSQLVEFRGGQRACVIVLGDHNPIAPLEIEIRDEKGKLVGRDEPAAGVSDPKAKGNDVGAVIWYPPRDGYYTITVKNLGEQYNECWIAIK
jgi:hypothetical protein